MGYRLESCREDMRDGSMRSRVRTTRPAPPLPSRMQSARRHNPGL